MTDLPHNVKETRNIGIADINRACRQAQVKAFDTGNTELDVNLP